jgi:hypothetical protein
LRIRLSGQWPASVPSGSLLGPNRFDSVQLTSYNLFTVATSVNPQAASRRSHQGYWFTALPN